MLIFSIKLLSKWEQDPKIILQSVTEECRRLINLKHNKTEIEKSNNYSGVNDGLKVTREKKKLLSSSEE